MEFHKTCPKANKRMVYIIVIVMYHFLCNFLIKDVIVIIKQKVK